ncbi:NAD-dependent epimerase/dehydratase family protein [Ilumatobacter nonamiensis]|uniref:NAD-dependent epimerase/dehydratase family protein n=1 Tax=Ilumatobacter nonamiensis TaxID=467093 RepID=UPI00058D52AD|nr:NAD-dependent epimerase/dehydratase family protein [Ilumatobacter nonamiensis]
MRVAVTGGAGFIGSNLCEHLLATDGVQSIAIIDDLSNSQIENLDGLNVEFVEGTILDHDALDRTFDGADAVVHLAALGSVPRSVANPIASHAVNATGTVMVLEAARRHGNLHTIVAGSSSVYGANPTLPKHEDLATRPLSPYGGSKLATEAYALAWGASYGLPVLPFRFFNVFGPKQPAGHVYAAVIPAFVDSALRSEPVTVHGDGMQSRDFTYVGTVTAAITQAILDRTVSDAPVNLAFGSRITLLDALEELEGVLGHPVERNHIEPRAGDVRHSQADNSRLLELLPNVEAVSFIDGLTTTVDWMRTTHA